MATRVAKRRIAAVGIGVAAVAAVTVGTTTAYFTANATVDNNVFSSATLDLQAGPASSALTLAGIVPGDTVTAPITVTNAGTAALRYAGSVATTGGAGLASALQVSVKTGIAAGSCTNAGFAGGTLLVPPTALGPSAALFGSAAQGQQATPNGGDRALAGSASEVLCVQVSLPSTVTDKTLGGQSTTATFTFNGEQTKNN